MKLKLRVDELRKARGMSYSELARKMDVSYPTARALCGDKRSVRLADLEKLRELFNVCVCDLFTEPV